MSTGIGSTTLVLIDVALRSGGYATNITVKGQNWGDYFIYDDVLRSWVVMSNRIILGDHTRNDNTTTMGIGLFSGYIQQSPTAVAIGYYAGNGNQDNGAIAIGANSGQQSQDGIAIGHVAGYNNQQPDAIAIGLNAGYQYQNSIALGYNAGFSGQQPGAIAIGSTAGYNVQHQYAIAIGNNAGRTNQSSYSIAIGNNVNALTTNTIVIDASSSTLSPATAGVFIRPIRGPMMANNLLSWDTTTKEIFYNGSSERFKYDIKPLTTPPNIDNLTPRKFKYKSDDSSDIGLIAEEAFNINNAFAYLDKDGIPEGIQWNTITACLIKEIQQMKKRIEVLKKRGTRGPRG